MLVGLDLSLTSTGVAYDLPDGSVATKAITARRKGVERLVEIRNHVLDLVLGTITGEQAELVVIEGYSYGTPGMATRAHSLGELGGVIRVALYEVDVKFVDVSPSSAKKFLTDSGNAAKARVLSAAVKASGLGFGTTDEADAWTLREIACYRLGRACSVQPAAYRDVVVSRIEWPDMEIAA